MCSQLNTSADRPRPVLLMGQLGPSGRVAPALGTGALYHVRTGAGCGMTSTKVRCVPLSPQGPKSGREPDSQTSVTGPHV